MKILLIIPNLGNGGAQQVFRNQLEFYSRHFEVTGCIFNWDGALPNDHNLKIISLDVQAGNHLVSKFYFFIKRVLEVRKVKRTLSINCSISHLEGADYVNILSKGGEKIACWLHGTKEFDENIDGFLGIVRKRILIPYLYRRADLLIPVSQGIRSELIQKFKLQTSKIKVIVNGLDLAFIHKMAMVIQPKWLTFFQKGNILITHCRLAKQKNLRALIDIYSKLEKSSIKLLILGDGELKQQLLDQCVALDLKVWDFSVSDNLTTDHQVYFLGYQSNPYPFLRSASLFLMTSSWEGFPLALCEAMACGLPVISTDCQTGPREILAPGLQGNCPVEQPLFTEAGVLMPLANSDESKRSWAAIVEQVLTDKILLNRLAKGASERVLDFDIRNTETQWLEVLHD